MEALVYDRTASDAATLLSLQLKGYDNLSATEKADWGSLRNKGAWNYTDANRIESWLNFTFDQLASYGYFITGFSRNETLWSEYDYFYLEDLTRLRNNLQCFYDQWTKPPEWEVIDFSNKLSYQDANLLEKNLQLINQFIKAMVDGYAYATEIYAGEAFI